RGARHTGVLHRALHVAHGGSMGGNLPRGPTFEVDAPVEASDPERHQAQHDDEARHREPPPASADEVEFRLAPVDADEGVGTAALGLFLGGQRRGGHAWVSLPSARPRATPMTRASVMRVLRPRRMTRGRVKKNVVNTSSRVDSPRKKAKPLTVPTARM